MPSCRARLRTARWAFPVREGLIQPVPATAITGTVPGEGGPLYFCLSKAAGPVPDRFTRKEGVVNSMQRMFLHSKIRDIRLTAVRPDYEGSITIDEGYLEQAGILPFEEVHVLNLSTGGRIVTYAISGARGSGCIELNGPAARLGMPGDEIMVLTYALLESAEIERHKPTIVCINPSRQNR